MVARPAHRVMPEWGAVLIECILVALVIITLYAVFAIVLIYMERKVCAFFQCRLGPMRVANGPAAGVCRRVQDAHQRDHRDA